MFGIPPTLSVLAARVEAEVAPAREACFDAVDREGLEQFTGDVGFLDRDRSKRDYEQALHDADWIAKETAARAAGVSLAPEAVLAAVREDPKTRGRVDRYLRGKARVRAVRAAQARLVCEGLLSPKSRYTPGSYDLPTHEALATWERKHDIFGWGLLGGETLGMLLAPTRSLLLDDLRRVLAERVADAAGIVEDGSINQARRRNPPTWRDAAGATQPVPDLIDDYVNALLAAIGVQTPEQAVAFLRAHQAGLAGLHVAFKAPTLAGVLRRRQFQFPVTLPQAPTTPPFFEHGPQRRDRSRRRLVRPAVRRARQAGRAAARPLPAPDTVRALAGAEDSALLVAHDDRLVAQRDARGRTRVLQVQELRHRAAGLEGDRRRAGLDPPDGTPAKDLLTRKVLDRNLGPVVMVNTDVMGPGYGSAYGLVMGIHVDPQRGNFDNQIRTHGSVDYTSIARRFSHGCHRLVNNRAVRLYDFVLRHHTFKRIGNVPLNLKKRLEVDGDVYHYAIKTRGYYYELPSRSRSTCSRGGSWAT